ncbi:MAG: Thermophilic serine proteinase [Anaerolineales bacterium]|nr:Thermophilic serine proteinase [Anaerolineales bacterium]
MLRTIFLLMIVSAIVSTLVSLPLTGAGQALASPATPEVPGRFAPGQVLVRFRPDISETAAASVAAAHNASPIHRIADHAFVLSVPVGREALALKALASDPAVENVSLNYLITETPLEAPKPLPLEAASPGAAASFTQETPSCITDLWMSTAQQGERLLDSMVASGSPQVYIFFEYADCDLEAVRAEVIYLSPDAAPDEAFVEEGFIISGSGIQGIKVQAWPYFEEGTFPVGRYLTILSLSPEGGWDEVKNVSWHVSTFPNDFWFRGVSNYQWNLHSTGRRAQPEADINMPQAWDTTTGGQDIVIAFVSTGVKLDHPDLKPKMWANRNEIPDNGIDDDENGCPDDVHGCEFFNGEANPDPTDGVNWGTFSGGIAAAATNNEIGIAGISWGARIMPLKVLRLLPSGVLGGYLSDLITAIEYAVNNGARIIHLEPVVAEENVTDDQLERLRGAIDEATNRGALVIAGAGDSAEDHLRPPAGFENVVAVGATNQRNEHAWFSNSGPAIDLVAPGELILIPCASAPYCIGSGTSLAAAHVDGVAALIWSANPELSPAEVRDILRESARDLGAEGYDSEYGYGMLDAGAALELTPHRLWLRTANPDQLTLAYLLDDQVSRVCQTVWNVGTGPRTWNVRTNSEWLSTETPRGPRSAPVPSHMPVCADAGLLSRYGVFNTTLFTSSTLSRHEGPVAIDVTAIYEPELWRTWLSLVARLHNSQ